MTINSESNFHAGETAQQERLGIAKPMARMSKLVIYNAMPDQHRNFYNQLPFAVIAMVDREGYPIATLVNGDPGFITTPDDRTLVIADQPLLAEELDIELSRPTKIGFLGIELHTRRRNRLNGMLRTDEGNYLVIDVEQSFGNCPQYIQLRDISLLDKLDNRTRPVITQMTDVSPAVKSIVEKADTFFIGSRTAELNADPRTGLDVSHRGGKPGFVMVSDTGILSFPDFSGNRFFNTLGNITVDDRVSLLFPDFVTGHILIIAGKACIDWTMDNAELIDGAERLINIEPDKIILAESALPLRAKFLAYSPSLEETGTGVAPNAQAGLFTGQKPQDS